MPKPIDSSMPDAQVVPEARLEKRSRRQFTTEYKLRIVAEAERCKRGELGTRTYNKTGSTSRLCGDMGIVLVRDGAGLEYPYTVIGVIEKSTRAKNYTQWIRSRGKVIGEVSGLVYAGIAKRHGI